MKRQLIPAIILFLAMFLIGVVAVFAFDTLDSIMPTQGFLAKSNGDPVPDGPHTFVFKIYSDSVGGTAKWTETHAVNTKAGMWSVSLGSITKIPDSVMTSPKVFLGMKVGTDPEMTPRTRLGTTPFARFSAGINGHIRTEPGKIRIMDTDTSSNAGIAMDATSVGGTIKIANPSAPGDTIKLGPPDTVFRVIKNGKAVISADATGTGGSITLGSQSAPGDSIKLGPPDTVFRLFKSGKAIISAFMNGAMGALNLTDGIDDDKIAMEPHGISLTTGARATTVAGLSAQGLTLTAGASDGYVLTSNASGLGTWKAATGSGSSCWLCPTGNYTYLSSSTDSVGIGVTTPTAKLDVAGNIACASSVSNSSISAGLTTTGTNDGTGDAIGAYGQGWGNGSGTAYGALLYGIGTGSGTHYGLYAYSGGTGSGSHYGIYAVAEGSGPKYAGFFGGDVHVNGTLSKAGGSFKIDHPLDPENKYLQHSFVESPDMKNIYDGNVITDANGDAVVSLPSYFSALNQDFRYQLTVIGQFAQAIVSQKIVGNQFSIKTDKPNVEVSWQVTGIRKDAWAEKNRIQVEIDKKPEEKGKYLHPEAFGKLIEQSVDYEQIKAARDAQAIAPATSPDLPRR